jgi:hypothetical protein
MKSNNINSYGSNLILELILTSELYMNQYIDSFPDMTDNALSFSVDPECSCRESIITHYNQNTESVSRFTEGFLTENPNAIDLKQFISKYETNEVSGKFFKIEKTEEAYANFIKTSQTENWIYNHMSITTDDDSYTIFFA